MLHEAAERAGVRVLAIDRPGVGLSSFASGRRLLDWPDDVSVLADELGADRFSVVGFSGGGPFALACACKIPDRLAGCGIVSGPTEPGLLAFLASRVMPFLLIPLAHSRFRDRSQAQRSLARLARRWPEADRKSLGRPEVREILAASLVEQFRQGTKGGVQDAMLLGAPWGFSLENIAFPQMRLWHGELDKQISVVQAHANMARLPRCEATYLPNDAHISTLTNHADDIVRGLTGAP
ncbi:alpha/beta hydrolase [Mesorhizobium sp. M0046]